ncbi:hypothetical protein JCM10212_000769, partial [Sporobolomyces blumeae]
MKFSVLTILAAAAVAVTAAPAGERRALDERGFWGQPSYSSTEDPAAKRDLDERGFWGKPSYSSTEDPAAKRD